MLSSSRRGAFVLLVAWAALAMAAPAAAAPAPFERLPFSCEDLGNVDLLSPGNGTFTPGFIDDTHALFVPHSIDIMTSSSVGGTERNRATKAGPIPIDAITCTIDTTIHLDGIAYTIVGSAIGTVEGQR
jgi:hypothetical protein